MVHVGSAVSNLRVLWRPDQRPFGLNLGETPEQDLAEAAGLLDLADHRLDRLLAQPVARAAAAAFELLARRPDQGAAPPVFALAGCFCRPVAT